MGVASANPFAGESCLLSSAGTEQEASFCDSSIDTSICYRSFSYHLLGSCLVSTATSKITISTRKREIAPMILPCRTPPSLQSCSPVLRFPSMVLNGDDEQEIVADLIDNAVRKAMNLAAPHSLR